MKKRIILIRGAFDVLHVGHLRTLNKIKKYGEKLIIALDSDKTVSNRKLGRPIFSQETRKEFLENLKPVDKVFISRKEGAYDIIKKVKPDILILKRDSDTMSDNPSNREKLLRFCDKENIKIIYQNPSTIKGKSISTTSVLAKL